MSETEWLTETQLTPGTYVYPLISADGQVVAFYSHFGTDFSSSPGITVYHRPSREFLDVTQEPSTARLVSLSGDGRFVSYRADNNPASEQYLAQIDYPCDQPDN